MLTPTQRIKLTEAALINYFRPRYNIEYKENFPNIKHSSYDECYKLDINAVSIEINTELHFFSKRIRTKNTHFKRYFLSTDEERRKVFDFSAGFLKRKVSIK